MGRKVARIDHGRCDRSPFCPVKRVCPVKAVTGSMFQAPTVSEEDCTGCGKCLNYCPMGAVTMINV
ncbi:ATP-binding protein [Fusibacter tunisiensis]|uniref:Fe-S-cluster-containing hydrogenase component 2 n=1 Tax=Fusibacter tunisiensis TaxID=1008308 RepID=A0ABS2MSE8_9FIRM|nr:4Fe-4S binding protein [Fusibacter tunisiensis]MBM7562287.1 Fe-S-cluster-containing hydrogenase component 2 [Fusibacter tunisiensis]